MFMQNEQNPSHFCLRLPEKKETNIKIYLKMIQFWKTVGSRSEHVGVKYQYERYDDLKELQSY